MFPILALVYIAFILLIVISSFFIVTRLQEYSINPTFTKPLIIMFVIVTIILIIVNFSFFVAIPFDEMFYSDNLY